MRRRAVLELLVAELDRTSLVELARVLVLGGDRIRRDGKPVPVVVDELLSVFSATRRQATTFLDGGDAAAEGGEMALVLYELDEVAARMRVSVRTVERLIADGRLVAVQISPRERRVRPADLQAYIDGLGASVPNNDETREVA